MELDLKLENNIYRNENVKLENREKWDIMENGKVY